VFYVLSFPFASTVLGEPRPPNAGDVTTPCSSTFGRAYWMGVSPSQGLHTQDSTTEKDEDKHSRLEQDSNPRSQGRSDKDPRPRQSGHCDRLQVIIRTDVTVGGLVVSALATGRFVGSNSAENNGFLMAIKIRGTTSFEEMHVKEPYRYEKTIFLKQTPQPFLTKFLLFRY
jgi:hypothetical protein